MGTNGARPQDAARADCSATASSSTAISSTRRILCEFSSPNATDTASLAVTQGYPALIAVNDTATLMVTVSELEDALEQLLLVVDESLQKESNQLTQEQQRPPVWYWPTPDMVWLACQRRRQRRGTKQQQEASSDCTSLTGLWQEENSSSDGAMGSNEHDQNLHFTMWSTRLVASNNDKSLNGSVTTPYDWTRRTLSYVPPSFRENGGRFDPCNDDDDDAARDALSAHCQIQRTVAAVQWVDLRPAQQQGHEWLEASAHIFVFLQSLLGSSHGASPWVVPTNNDTQEQLDCVLLVCQHPAPKALRTFRVSDACPSWCLFSSLLLNLSTPSTENDNGHVLASMLSSSPQPLAEPPLRHCEVLVYRRLPPRMRLSYRHPLTNETTPVDGCLWETVVTMPEVDAPDNGPTGTIDDEAAEPIISYRLVGPPYIDFVSEYAQYNCLLHKLLDADIQQVLRLEASRIDHLWTAWPEQQHYRSSSAQDPSTDDDDAASQSAPWNVFPLCHTFPAHDLSRRQWIAATIAHVPRTVALLQQYGGDWVRTALYSRLDANAVLEAHTGWADLANHVYRIHIPIAIPDHSICGTWVDGCVVQHRSDALLAFDDSKTHRAFHYTTTPASKVSDSNPSRIVLIVDVARPPHLPVGTATGGHSEELDAFIAQFSKPS
jgi:Aspartyl/Asparaginyl beta-hydroxylase